jgi:oligopeptide/dipeptide ABC transporter ATP-binding protein
MPSILEVKDLCKTFGTAGNRIYAVNNVTFSMEKGEIFGVVGESGSGKSTAALCVLRLHNPDSGTVAFRGRDITRLSERELRPLRRHIQMVFQDPTESLNPRMTVGRTIMEPLQLFPEDFGGDRRKAVLDIMGLVGLQAEYYTRFPHQLSTGQRQRVGFARAIVLNPDLVILDEPTSALDVSVRGQVLDLLLKLQAEFDLSYLMISHDLNVIWRMCHRIAVMYLGSIVEIGTSDEIFLAPLHPYTQALVSAIPSLQPAHKKNRIGLKGEIPSPANIPPGCPFSTRCFIAEAMCGREVPKLRLVGGRQTACHLVTSS